MSKLGFHVNAITDPDKMYTVFTSCKPAVIKTLDHNADFWQRVKLACPYTLLLGRLYVEQQPLEHPKQEAMNLANRINCLEVSRIYDAWEGYNETPREQREARYVFDTAMARELHKYGLKYCCGSWSVGVPDISDWWEQGMLDSLRASDYVSVHEYCAPTMNDPRGFSDHGSTGWFTLRYRQWYPKLPLDCQKLLIISECGIDSGAAHWPVSFKGGWRSFAYPEEYLVELKWYDSWLMQDDYVAGACIYTWGTRDPQWDSWDIKGGMVDLLAEYIATHVVPPPSPMPTDLERRVTAIEAKLYQISITLASTT